MNLRLIQSTVKKQSEIKITGSKSETNRLLLLKAFYPSINLENTSNSDDSEVMLSALESSSNQIDIHHAGTAMRFLTAYFSIQEGREITLTGSSRMKERPIKILVEALQQLGASISYVEKEGFPPLKINGTKITKNKVTLPADISSQYISALLLIAPKLENGLELTLDGAITSEAYIKMTLGILNELGIQTSFNNNTITVLPKAKIDKTHFTIESDWSSASYYYAIVALSPLGTKITLSSYKQNSLQGDAVLAEIYTSFGVTTVQTETGITLCKEQHNYNSIRLNLNNAPDIAQTIAVTCFGLGVGCNLYGLHTLKIKETDRLEALRKELAKLGASIITSDSGLILSSATKIKNNISIKTYQDHRMAMAFAPLALKTTLIIEEAEVVSKSYPTFWSDIESIGFLIDEQ
jgi:3-phosphoshikimate 1-carboxyvinyltransferase